MPLVSPSIYRLQEWVGVEASDRAQDRGIHPEEGRAGKRAGGSEEPDGLASKDEEADPSGPNQVLPGHLRERVRSRESRYAAQPTITAALAWA